MSKFWNIKQPFKSFFIKALIIALCFGATSLVYHKEIIRDNIGDAGFDLTNFFFSLVKTPKQDDTPPVIVFAIDSLYMNSRGLLDVNNDVNYGYQFPRKYLANFVNVLDLKIKESQVKIQSLFIDYDFSFTLGQDGEALTKDDQLFIQALKVKRNYSILLPKTQINNFIENSKDKKIQKLIHDKKIQFVSVNLLTNNDNSARRYLAFRKFEDKRYNNVAIELWRQNGGNISNLKNDDIVSNRILIKSNRYHPPKENCISKYNNWKGYSLHSANCLINDDFDMGELNLNNAIVMLGSTYQKNNDKHDIFMNGSLNGVEMLANTLMTLFYLDGQVKKVNWWQNMLLAFVITLFVDILVSLFSAIKNGSFLHSVITASATLSLMALLSFYLLTIYGYWFNWFIPIALYTVYEFFEFIYKLIKTRKK